MIRILSTVSYYRPWFAVTQPVSFKMSFFCLADNCPMTSLGDFSYQKTFSGQPGNSSQTLETEPNGYPVTITLGGMFQSKGCHVCAHRYQTGPLVRGQADVKKRARLNCIRYLLSMIPYTDLTPKPSKLFPRVEEVGYVCPPFSDETFVLDYYD